MLRALPLPPRDALPQSSVLAYAAAEPASAPPMYGAEAPALRNGLSLAGAVGAGEDVYRGAAPEDVICTLETPALLLAAAPAALPLPLPWE